MSGWVFPKPCIIFISGKAGTGKSTVGKILASIFEENEYDVCRMAFAKEVKDVATKCYDWNGQKDQKGRRLLQNVGNIGREYNESIWAKKAEENIFKSHKLTYPQIIIFDDWRYRNEYEYFTGREYNLFTIRIEAPNREILRGTPEYFDISETSLDRDFKFDLVLSNTGSPEELFAAVDEIAKHIIDINTKNVL